MGTSLPRDRNKKTLFLAIGASVIAGAATMFIPTSVLEGITGATGLSEIIPATAAPLGDKARAMIAFGAGAVTLAIMALWLFGREEADDSDYSFPAEPQTTQESNGMIDGDMLTAIKDRIVNFNLPKMPWTKADNDIRDLEDLPRVRVADQHPDAPPRHPLSVNSEMAPEPFAPQPPAETEAKVANPQPVIPEAEAPKAVEPVPGNKLESAFEEPGKPLITNPITQNPIATQPRTTQIDPAKAAAKAPMVSSPQLGDMIGQLETAMKMRQQQLAQLEMVSSQLAAEKQAASQKAADDRPAIAKGIHAETKAPAEKRPVLEEVKPVSSQEGEVDNALNAALETLQRMNAQSR